MTKMQENRNENKKLISRNVFVNMLVGERFLNIEEIKCFNSYKAIVEKDGIEDAYFCDTYEELLSLLRNFNVKDKITVFVTR